MPSQYQITFWNLENLLDVEGSPRRGDKLQRAIGKDLAAIRDIFRELEIGGGTK